MSEQERIQLLTRILVEFDGQRMLIEAAVRKIEKLYTPEPDPEIAE